MIVPTCHDFVLSISRHDASHVASVIDEQTNVILVSDHRYECGHRRPPPEEAKRNPEGCHRGFGIACLKGPDIKENERLYGATILDVTPTMLALLGLPVGGDMDGRPWLEVFRNQAKLETRSLAGRVWVMKGPDCTAGKLVRIPPRRRRPLPNWLSSGISRRRPRTCSRQSETPFVATRSVWFARCSRPRGRHRRCRCCAN